MLTDTKLQYIRPACTRCTASDRQRLRRDLLPDPGAARYISIHPRRTHVSPPHDATQGRPAAVYRGHSGIHPCDCHDLCDSYDNCNGHRNGIRLVTGHTPTVLAMKNSFVQYPERPQYPEYAALSRQTPRNHHVYTPCHPPAH